MFPYFQYTCLRSLSILLTISKLLQKSDIEPSNSDNVLLIVNDLWWSEWIFNPSTRNLHFMHFHFIWVNGQGLQFLLSSLKLSLLIPFQLFPLFLMSYNNWMKHPILDKLMSLLPLEFNSNALRTIFVHPFFMAEWL